MAAACGTRSGYDRHRRLGETPCDACRDAAAVGMRLWRASKPKTPCGVCKRVHPGRCMSSDDRSRRLAITLPGRVARRLQELVPWGERSRWIAHVVEAELDRLEEQAA